MTFGEKKAKLNFAARLMLQSQDIEFIVACIEDTNDMSQPEMPTVRGLLMDELERRDARAFEAWLDSHEDSPRKFYIVKEADRGITHRHPV